MQWHEWIYPNKRKVEFEKTSSGYRVLLWARHGDGWITLTDGTGSSPQDAFTNAIELLTMRLGLL